MIARLTTGHLVLDLANTKAFAILSKVGRILLSLLFDLKRRLAHQRLTIIENLRMCLLVAVDVNLVEFVVLVEQMKRDKWRAYDVLQLKTLDRRVFVLNLCQMPKDETSKTFVGHFSLVVIDGANFDLFFEYKRTALEIVKCATPGSGTFLERHFSLIEIELFTCNWNYQIESI